MADWAQPILAARFEIGWQPRYPTTLLFLSLSPRHLINEDDLKKEDDWQGIALQHILPKISWTILTIVIEWWYRKTSYRRCPGQSRSGRLRYTNTNTRDITNIITYHCTAQSVNNQWGQSRLEQEYWHEHRHYSHLYSQVTTGNEVLAQGIKMNWI